MDILIIFLTCVHCVFDLSEPHGDIYAAVSETLAKKYNKTVFVPHMSIFQPNKYKFKKYNSQQTNQLFLYYLKSILNLILI